MGRDLLPPTAARLGEMVRERGFKLYALAARIGVHPSKLGQVLRGRAALTPELAERIHRAVSER